MAFGIDYFICLNPFKGCMKSFNVILIDINKTKITDVIEAKNAIEASIEANKKHKDYICISSDIINS